VSGDEVKRAAERGQLLSDLRDTFGTAAGRRVLSRIYAGGRLFESVYVQNAQIHKLAGIQEFVQGLFQLVQEADVEINISILRESAQPSTTETSDGRGNDQG
jgi:hypothetical protein